MARAIAAELTARVPAMSLEPRELTIAGALRSARADVSESHPQDGVRVAIEIKPVNVAVGRALWNRFGDVRAFAVNVHLKFPFAVVGGILAVPTWEWGTTKTDNALIQEERGETPVMNDPLDEEVDETDIIEELSKADRARGDLPRISTVPLVERLIARLTRIRRREIEADPAHLLEALGLLVYDPDEGTLSEDLPGADTGLRWDQFLDQLADSYKFRFG